MIQGGSEFQSVLFFDFVIYYTYWRITMNLEQLSALDLGTLVNNREVSAVEVTEYFLQRIFDKNTRINAFTYVKPEEALADARGIDNKLKKNESVGPFAGVPVGLKDFLPSRKGWTNSHGGVKSLLAIDDANSMFYTAARDLGCVTLGKTNAPAFGFSGACSNKMYGETHNPFVLDRTSGGSSGGSAAAVASGMLIMAEGGDAGGSIRIPSGWCNLFGFKPSLGTVPSYCRPDGWSATHPYCFNGSITKTVSDSAIMLSKMAKYNPRDPISLPINAGKDFFNLMNKPMKGKKIAFTFDFDVYPVDEEVKSIVWDAVNCMKDAGISVEFVNFNFKHSLAEIMKCWCWSISVDTAIDLANWKNAGLDLVKDHRDELPEEFIRYNEIASNLNIFDMRRFNEIRTDILDNFEDVFEKYDFIASPTAICPALPLSDNGRAIKVNEEYLDPDVNFIEFGETPFANFVGYPAASVPAGISKCGSPIGMQIIGKQYQDASLMALCHTYEKLNPWNDNYKLSM